MHGIWQQKIIIISTQYFMNNKLRNADWSIHRQLEQDSKHGCALPLMHVTAMESSQSLVRLLLWLH